MGLLVPQTLADSSASLPSTPAGAQDLSRGWRKLPEGADGVEHRCLAEPAISGGPVQQLLREQPARVPHGAQLPGRWRPVALEGASRPASPSTPAAALGPLSPGACTPSLPGSSSASPRAGTAGGVSGRQGSQPGCPAFLFLPCWHKDALLTPTALAPEPRRPHTPHAVSEGPPQPPRQGARPMPGRGSLGTRLLGPSGDRGT